MQLQEAVVRHSNTHGNSEHAEMLMFSISFVLWGHIVCCKFTKQTESDFENFGTV